MPDFPNQYEEKRKESPGEEGQRLADFLIMVLRVLQCGLTPEEEVRFRNWFAKWVIRRYGR